MTTPDQQLSEEDLSTYERRYNRALKQSKKIEKETREINDEEAFSVENLEKLVAERPQSNTAKRLLESVRFSERGTDALKCGNSKLAASNLAEAYRRSSQDQAPLFHTIGWNNDLVNLAMSSMNNLYSDTSQDKKTRAEALFVHATCLRYFFGQHQKALSQYRLAQILLPQDPYILAEEGRLLGLLSDHNRKLEAFQKAAKLCGDDEPEISLFHLACSLWKLGRLDLNDQYTVAHASYLAQATSLFEKYVQCAEPDALKLPSALYYLALINGHQGPSSIGRARRYLAMAEEAEKRGLPFDQNDLIPEGRHIRAVTRTFLKKYIACGNEKCSAAAEHPCSKCEQVCYCSQECLNADWPSHKAFCKKYCKGKDKKTSKN